ncbi:DNRLRE domain-containing protein [Bacillus amyloliquefaciens]|uniref:DNRLRE domain-containing protein n=1 Tax=Bacillus amyloliquefaciens TaxID=1390 RepID=UPI0022AE964E|nr:DNRLRE domain-containing protein [Bacillus amyloliquefaciens]MCZ4246925.1 DNRLRE domain-containing protein [Bacillus amyloliquefaciens]
MTWFDLTYKKHNATLTDFDFSTDRGWTGENINGDPYSLSLNGSSNYMTVDRFDELIPRNGGFTLEAWIRPSNTGYILSFGKGDEQGFSLYYDQSSNEFRAQITTESHNCRFTFNGVPVKKWTHIALVFDGERLWGLRNAAPEGFSLPEAGNYKANSYDLVVGKDCAGNQSYFEGQLSVLRLYERSLTFDEISDSYNQGMLSGSQESEIRGKGLILYRDELQSTLRIGITGNLESKYQITKNKFDDLSSNANVKECSDLKGIVVVNPITYVRGKYGTQIFTGDDLQGSLSVAKHNNLISSISVAPIARFKSRYGVNPLHVENLKSTLNVVSPNLLSDITVSLQEIKMAARYDSQQVSRSDLGGEVLVKTGADLPSVVGVNLITNRYMEIKYAVDGITKGDMLSEIAVYSTKDMQGVIKVNTRALITAAYQIQGIYLDDLKGDITVPAKKDIHSTISITIESAMRAKYDLTPTYLNELPTYLGIKEFSDLPSEIFINLKSHLQAEYSITPIYFGWLTSKLSIKEVSDLKSMIRLTPKGGMVARYDLRERPKVIKTLYSVRDAFVRSYLPKINYGTETQMYVGKVESPFPETFRSLVGFDINEVPQANTEIGKATLRIYNDGRGVSQAVQLNELMDQWNELSVTWDSQPRVAKEGFSTTYVLNNTTGKYTEIDVTPLVKDWHSGKKANFGFMLKAVNELGSLMKGFYTRENTERRPELLVEYYDMVVYTIDDSHLLSELSIRNSTEKDLKSQVKVKQYNFWEEVPGDMYIKAPGDIPSRIVVSRPQLSGSVTPRFGGHYDFKDGRISIRQKSSVDLSSFIAANEKDKLGEVYVLYRNDLKGSLQVRVWGDPDQDGGQLVSGLSVSEANKDSSIYVLNREDFDSLLTVRVTSNGENTSDNLTADFRVTRNFELYGSLEIKESAQFICSIVVRAEGEGDQHSSVYVRYRNDLPGKGNIGNPNLKSHIKVYEKSLLGGQVVVRRSPHNDLVSAINVPQGDREELPSTVNLRTNADKYSTVTILSGNLQSSLTVPNNGFKNLVGALSVRVRRVSDLMSYLGIASGNLGSSVGVRVNEGHELSSNILVRLAQNSNLSIGGFIKYTDSLPSNVSVNKSRYQDKLGLIDIRKLDSYDVAASAEIKAWNDPWGDGGQLSASISVRNWCAGDLPSQVSVRFFGAVDIYGSLTINQVSELTGSVEIQSFGEGNLVSAIDVYEYSELTGVIRIRVSDNSDLKAISVIKISNDLSAGIEVITAYPYAYIM